MEQLDGIIKRWWVALIFGIVAIILGIYILFNPIESYLTLSYVFALYFIVFGIYKAITVFREREKIPAWGWSFGLAIISIILGVILLLPGMAPGTFLYYVGFSVLFMGINSCSTSFALKDAGDKHWGWTLAFGIISIILSIIMVISPLFAIGFITYYFAFMFIFYGIHLCYLSYRLSVLNSKIKKSH